MKTAMPTNMFVTQLAWTVPENAKTIRHVSDLETISMDRHDLI